MWARALPKYSYDYELGLMFCLYFERDLFVPLKCAARYSVGLCAELQISEAAVLGDGFLRVGQQWPAYGWHRQLQHRSSSVAIQQSLSKVPNLMAAGNSTIELYCDRSKSGHIAYPDYVQNTS